MVDTVYWLPIMAGWSLKPVGLIQRWWLLSDVLYSLHELSELLQWLCHDDSTINIVLVITITIITARCTSA